MTTPGSGYTYVMPMNAKERRIKQVVVKRGGATRIRTESMPGGGYRRVYVVRMAGPRGGHTVVGPERQSKEIPSGGLTKSKGSKR